MKRGYIHRWLAVVLLAYASADIYQDSVSPQQCCEWMDNLAVSECAGRVPSAGVSNIALPVIAPGESREESSVPSNPEEDCFCCCGHMLPAVHYSAPVVEVRSCLAYLTKTLLPAAPPQKKFHPPRLS
jgi:hypothetical protein